MATAMKTEMDRLADQMAVGLRLNSSGQLLNFEELVYKASPQELAAYRQLVLQKQTQSGFDDEGLMKRFVSATKPKAEKGSGDSQSYYNCFQNQIMLPVVAIESSQVPADLHRNWLCIICPQGDRVLVIATHKSTRVYDLAGTWLCEHDAHLPAGSPSPISRVDDDSQCTVLDCLYNEEEQTYYVVDVLCWKGLCYYKLDAKLRIKTAAERLKDVPSLKQVSQTNPFKFLFLPSSEKSYKDGICAAISRTSFEISGLLFYHHDALYSPGLSPLGLWVETEYIPRVLDIQIQKEEILRDLSSTARWRLNRYEMAPEKSKEVHNAAYSIHPARRNFGGILPPPFLHYPKPASRGDSGDLGYSAGYNKQQRPQHLQQRPQHLEQRPLLLPQHAQNRRGKRQDNNGPMRKIMLPAPVPDERPNWPENERHEVMMSVTMEYAPENLERDYLAVICPVAKRRIVVSFMGWTCSYNKLLAMDRKFQSSLPGGNVRSVQVIKSNDLCILDCLHYKADRTFFVLDLMHWKQLPYYQSEAEFRFHWINQIESEMDLVSIHSENEYKFRAMPRIRCNQKDLHEALANATFKVDGLLFFHKHSCYQSGTSCNVLWLPPGDIEKVLGWKPPEKALPQKKSDSAPTAASGSKISAVSGAEPTTLSAGTSASSSTETSADSSTATAASSSTATAASSSTVTEASPSTATAASPSTGTAASPSTGTAASPSTGTAASPSTGLAASSSTGTAETALEGLEKTASTGPAATISAGAEDTTAGDPPTTGSESAAAGDATATAASL